MEGNDHCICSAFTIFFTIIIFTIIFTIISKISRLNKLFSNRYGKIDSEHGLCNSKNKIKRSWASWKQNVQIYIRVCMWESLLGVEAQRNLKRILLSDDIVDSGIGDKSLTWKPVLSKEIFSLVSHLTLGFKSLLFVIFEGESSGRILALWAIVSCCEAIWCVQLCERLFFWRMGWIWSCMGQFTLMKPLPC